jgi:hypothetical protein
MPVMTVTLPALPTGWTVSSSTYSGYAPSIGSGSTAPFGSNANRQPSVFNIQFPTSSFSSGGRPSSLIAGVNVVCTHADGASPYEQLGIYSGGYQGYGGTPSATQLPVVTTDATVFRTVGPSLKVNLATRTALFWSTITKGKSTKLIKVPVTAGASTTVSGYIRTDQGAYANGDTQVFLMFNDTQLGTQSMTTACINAWEQFTMTFTPTYTGEAVLCWEMYFSAGASSYWMDDLTIT